MAVVVRTLVEGDQETHDRLEQVVDAAIARQGRPPDGLMVHLAYPCEGGFLIVEVWRSDDVFRSWWKEAMDPALAEAGITAREHEIGPVWSLARP